MNDEKIPGDGSGDGPGPVGSVADEAAKLFSALQDWAQDGSPRGGAGGDAGGAAAAAGSVLGDQFRSINEHLATGGKECSICPLCQVINKVRGASPEVRTHLAVATSSLLQAAAALLEARASGADTPSGTRSGSPEQQVTKIDLDDEPEDPAAGP